MVNVCFYFQVHQPYRLKQYSVFSIGKDHDYFNEQKNEEIMKRVAKKCYMPTNKILLKLIEKFKGRFKVAFSISGTALEQLQEYAPEAFDSFRALAKTGKVEFLSETYYHSLASLYSKTEFAEQVKIHRDAMIKHSNYKPTVFRNTELIFTNDIAREAEKMGYKGILAEGADHILGWRTPDVVYTPKGTKNIRLLLKNYNLSDDIAFRFSDKGWTEYPLTAKKYCRWLNKSKGDVINLFMDYETFGEHHWEDTGIHHFLRDMVVDFLKYKSNRFITPRDAVKEFKAADQLDISSPVSWSDNERDLSAWCGNRIQNSSIQKIFAIEKEIKESGDERLIRDWRRLTTSDHFYYMSTKHFNDGNVHKYFNPYNSPYDSFINFMNIMNDISFRLNASQNETDDIPKAVA